MPDTEDIITVEKIKETVSCQDAFELDMLRTLHSGTYWMPAPGKLPEAVRALSCGHIDMDAICQGCSKDNPQCLHLPERLSDMISIWWNLAGDDGLKAAHVLFSIGKPATPAAERFGIEHAIDALMRDCPLEDIVA